MRIAGNQSALYNGKAQEELPRTTNHPYLKDSQYLKARLSYFGIIYPEALLRLDLSRNELVVLLPNFQNVVLFPENVDFVELHGRHIIYHSGESLPDGLSTGYYSLLHSGDYKALEKQTAVIMTNRNTLEEYYAFLTNTCCAFRQYFCSR